VSAAISVRDVRKSYGDLRAVDGVTFEVGHGEFFGILGPNGAGKTTTLEIIEGLREPDGGEVTVLGLRPWPRNPALLPRIGVQLQATSFFERLTAREQLRTFADLYRVPARRADEMLEVVGLTSAAATRTEKLSGGQAQRLSIACALVHRPDVLFLDEPTGALDPACSAPTRRGRSPTAPRSPTTACRSPSPPPSPPLSSPGSRTGAPSAGCRWPAPRWRTSSSSSPGGSTGHEDEQAARPTGAGRRREPP